VVLIRPARLDDGNSLQGIELAAGARFRDVGFADVADHDPTSVDELARYATAGRSWVATHTGDIPVGYVVVDVVDGNAHIEQVSVAPSHARRGIGAALIDQVEAWGRAQGAPATTLTTFGDVAWNGPYYARLGYREMSAARIGAGLAATMDHEASMPGIEAARRCAMVKPNDPAGAVVTSG
jgi:GNAT superfamily N-acetyltransferase